MQLPNLPFHVTVRGRLVDTASCSLSPLYASPHVALMAPQSMKSGCMLVRPSILHTYTSTPCSTALAITCRVVPPLASEGQAGLACSAP